MLEGKTQPLGGLKAKIALRNKCYIDINFIQFQGKI